MAGGDCSKALSLLLRIAALCLSVAAAVVMGTAGDQVVTVDGDRRPSSYAVSYSQYNALKYFVAAAAISAACSAAALYLCAVRAVTAAVGSLPLVPLLDAAAQAFLFSAAGAAFAARGAAGGPSCSSACDAAGVFCGKVSVAAAAGSIAAVAIAVAALARDHARRSGGRSGDSCCDL